MKKTISLSLGATAIIICTTVLSFWYLKDTYKAEENTKNDLPVEITKSKVKILAIGDSLTAGYGLNLNDSYPAQLELRLKGNNFDLEIVNAGVSGETTAGLLERVDFIKSQRPDMVLITIGGNDAFRNTDVSYTKGNISKIIKSLKLSIPANKIFLMQIQAPENLGQSYTKVFNNMYKEIADQEKVNLVPFVVSEVFTKNEYMQGDGIHPNKQGYELLVNKYIFPSLVKSLAE